MYKFLKHSNGFFSVTTKPSAPPRIICFPPNKSQDAELCRKYMTTFNKRYGSWPEFDNRSIVKRQVKGIKFESNVEIVDKDFDEMRSLGEMYNVDFFICDAFEIQSHENKFHILVSGEELNVQTSIPMFLDYIEDMC